MIAAAMAWGLAVVFGTAALEKLWLPQSLRSFFRAAALFLPGRMGMFAAVLFLIGELAVIPLLLWNASFALLLLLLLSVVVTGFAARFWWSDQDCGCGGLWAASGRNLLIRNAILLAASVYVYTAAPVPIPLHAFLYALLGLAVWIVLVAVVEALRIRRYTL